jgi:hypothetical protein
MITRIAFTHVQHIFSSRLWWADGDDDDECVYALVDHTRTLDVAKSRLLRGSCQLSFLLF